MRFYLVRHGESEANVGGYINDVHTKPVALTTRGREQASAAADALRCIPFTHAYAPRSSRAHGRPPRLSWRAVSFL